MTTKVQFQNVSKQFTIGGSASLGAETQFTALEEVSFTIKTGEFLVVVGPSGCGKSTLLDLLAGLTLPTSGKILLDGKPIVGPGMDRGVVFQQYALFPWRTALENVEFGLELRGQKAKERRSIAREFLDLVGLSGFEHRHPHELSGGMKQRVAIARSLAYDPDILLMDEPFAALDQQTREILQGELVRIWQRSKKTIVFITHGIDEAVCLGERVVVMTSRPGRLKTIIDVPESLKFGEDVRSRPEYGAVRHEVWSCMRDEVKRAQEQERRNKLAQGAAAPSREQAAHV